MSNEALIAKLKRFRGPYLGDGINENITVAELIAALQTEDTPDAYLYFFQKPGESTQYASVCEHERRDNISDHEWATKVVLPLFRK